MPAPRAALASRKLGTRALVALQVAKEVVDVVKGVLARGRRSGGCGGLWTARTAGGAGVFSALHQIRTACGADHGTSMPCFLRSFFERRHSEVQQTECAMRNALKGVHSCVLGQDDYDVQAQA